MYKFRLLLVSIFVTLGLNACAAHVGQKISDSYAGTITRGKTTKNELESTLGKADLYFYGKDNQPYYIWNYAESGRLSTAMKMKNLIVGFDDQDRVNQISFLHAKKH